MGRQAQASALVLEQRHRRAWLVRSGLRQSSAFALHSSTILAILGVIGDLSIYRTINRDFQPMYHDFRPIFEKIPKS
jgi:hypothetical protein